MLRQIRTQASMFPFDRPIAPPVGRLVECVPNFSAGYDRRAVAAITQAICSVEGVRLLHVDMGEGANRTVVTFVGEPTAVVEAAYQGVRTAAEVIDMRTHHGAHPRIGATDVLPLVPLRGITLAECARLADELARRIGKELSIPVFLYEAASPTGSRLEQCRRGEYEALPERVSDADYGPRAWSEHVARTGATVVGARPFLLAVNFTLNTRSVDVAKDIARRLRTSGYRGVPGQLPAVKAIGWYIEEYRRAQVSMNLCDLSRTSLRTAYEATCAAARERGVAVSGTEIIGLVPQSQLDGVDDPVTYFHLDELRPFNPRDKVIELVAGL